MSDGKTVNSPLFDDLGGERSITLQGRAQTRSTPPSEQPSNSTGVLDTERREAPVLSSDERLQAAGFRKRGGAWRR